MASADKVKTIGYFEETIGWIFALMKFFEKIIFLTAMLIYKYPGL